MQTEEPMKREVIQALLGGVEADSEKLASLAVLEIEPFGDFVTYGIGVPLMQMRDREKARGRASVA